MSGPENPPAFPSTEEHPSFDMPLHFHGMTLRDWFAGQALGGQLASIDRVDMGIIERIGREAACEMFAFWSYKLADAMLAERAKATGQ